MSKTSIIQDGSKFLEEFQAVDILTGIIDKSKAPRVTVSWAVLYKTSIIQDGSEFLEEFQAVDILTGIIDKSKAPRVRVS